MGTGNVDGSFLPFIGYAGTFIVTVGTTVWGVAWKLSGIKFDLEKQIADTANQLREERIEQVEATRKDRTREIEASAREVGEGMAALRQKVVDMELWNRDNFVRRPDFQNVVDSFTRAIEGMRADMNAGYLRLDSKLDRVIQGIKEEHHQ